MSIQSKFVSRVFSPQIQFGFFRQPWRVWISLGLYLGSGYLGCGYLGEPSVATASEGETEEPLGLELWLSGEEPSGTVEAGSEGSEGDPVVESETTGSSQDDAMPGGMSGAMPGAMSSPPVAIEGFSPEASFTEPLSQEPELEASAVPTVVIEERASGCTVHLNAQGGVSASQGECAGKALHLVLEEQWREWYGDAAHGDSVYGDPVYGDPVYGNAARDPAYSSPLQVGVQAIGAAMQVSPFIQDYYFQTARPTPLASANDRVMLFPLKSWAPITSVFGWRTHPITQTWRLHTGTDLGALWGTPVVAAFSGRVEVADVLDGYGVTVVLDHPHRNQQTLYAHLSEVFVKPGDYLQQGEVLGRVGSTGNSTGPHLHFELREWQNNGWVALDAGSELAGAPVGPDQDIPVLAANPEPSLLLGGAAAAPNALQQWITWFLQMISTLA